MSNTWDPVLRQGNDMHRSFGSTYEGGRKRLASRGSTRKECRSGDGQIDFGLERENEKQDEMKWQECLASNELSRTR